ncbi:hypothetical protein [Paraliobacillus sp. JSM ZJ581]|uniref:hypothetical protein n=1 Tax=Paraliobacillus sp. JSM ZJ581 TaxID=3342118 RepID=UPI0035A8D923
MIRIKNGNIKCAKQFATLWKARIYSKSIRQAGAHGVVEMDNEYIKTVIGPQVKYILNLKSKWKDNVIQALKCLSLLDYSS